MERVCGDYPRRDWNVFSPFLRDAGTAGALAVVSATTAAAGVLICTYRPAPLTPDGMPAGETVLSRLRD